MRSSKDLRAAWLIVFAALATQIILAQTGGPSESDKLNALREQAERGDPKAEYELGRRYQNRPEPDYVEALRWYRKAADQGDARAQAHLDLVGPTDSEARSRTPKPVTTAKPSSTYQVGAQRTMPHVRKYSYA